MFCLSIFISLLFFSLQDAGAFGETSPSPDLVAPGNLPVIKRAPNATFHLCTGSNNSGTCRDFTVAEQCLSIPSEFTSLGSSSTSNGWICFVFKNTNCTGCEACVDPAGWTDMTSFADVTSMRCQVPNALACTDALCVHDGAVAVTAASSPPGTTSSPTSTASSPTSTSSSPTSPPVGQTSQPSGGGSQSTTNTGAIAGGIVGGVVGIILLALLFVFLLRKRPNDRYDSPEPQPSNEIISHIIEPFMTPTSPSTVLYSPKMTAVEPVTPAASSSAYAYSAMGGSSNGPSSNISSPTTNHSELEDRIRYLEKRLALAESGGVANENVERPSDPPDEMIQSLRSEIDRLHQQQQSMLQELRGMPPLYSQ